MEGTATASKEYEHNLDLKFREFDVLNCDGGIAMLKFSSVHLKIFRW